MKVVTCLLVISLVSLSAASGGINYKYIDGYGEDLTYLEEGRVSVTEADIVRPCARLTAECIRLYFAENHLCTPLEKPGPDPYNFDDLPMPLPHLNATYLWKHAVAKGLRDYTIREFYVNERLNRLVLEVELASLVLQTPKSFTIFHMKGKEPVITSDYLSITHSNVSLTLVISNLGKQPRTHVYTYLSGLPPALILGPRFTPKDPVALANFLTLVATIPLSLAEAFVFQGPVTMAMFFQTTISCDLYFSRTQY